MGLAVTGNACGRPEADGQPSAQGSLDSDFQDAIDVIQRDADNLYHDTGMKYYETLECHSSLGRQGATCYSYTSLATSPAATGDWSEQVSWSHIVPDLSLPPVHPEPAPFYPIMQLSRNRKGRKKLRLFEYLHEALHDANMVDSIQWTDRGSGTFHFVSKNKEKLAECWGRRKGNRKTMTYQKMARALRNYSRTGEIVKVRRKLTYQFNPHILQRLGAPLVSSGHPAATHAAREAIHPHPHPPPTDLAYYTPPVSEWSVWCGPYASYQGDYDLATVLTTPDATKNSSSTYMTDLEVILEFLDEHYRQEAEDRDRGGFAMPRSCALVEERQGLEQGCTYTCKRPVPQPSPLSTLTCHQWSSTHALVVKCAGNGECHFLAAHDRLRLPEQASLKPGALTRVCGGHPPPLSISLGKALLPPLPAPAHPLTPGTPDGLPQGSSTPAARGKKLRLFHFLFEMLENPGMAHCVSWVPSAASAGVFCFSSQHKEHVAQLWGRRKGNRRPMTYQKMSRALRNYAQSGEIVKVKRKLTYRFSCATLHLLRSQRGLGGTQHDPARQP
ncbi:hypothetical protein ACEWY4_002279 [Coilia grayii]|uniref:Transcription factor Spi-C n=1 Tax=Coilia grayii TaxID=363190 RepID=A0ABD1KVY2_9TELE